LDLWDSALWVVGAHDNRGEYEVWIYGRSFDKILAAYKGEYEVEFRDEDTTECKSIEEEWG
jgi:hypothetical protein